jgi:hypothetical protein
VIIINLILIFTILLQLVQITFDIKVNRYIYIFNLAQLIIIAITLYQNSYQWQMYPFSALYILCILVYRKGSHRSLITNKVGKNILIATCWVIFLLSILIFYYFPLPFMRKTTGSYPVGTTTYTISSPTCEDPVNGSGEYKVYMQVWYPAGIKDDSLANYAISKEDMERIFELGNKASLLNKVKFVFLPLSKSKSNSYLNVKPIRTSTPLPLVIYNGGANSVVGQNSMLMEDLASHGFVVVSIGHPYGSIINYGDGTTVKPDTEIVRKLFTDAGNELTRYLKLVELKAMNQNDKYTLEEKYYYKLNIWKTLTNAWESDSMCVIDFLGNKTKSPEDMFYQKIDMDNIAVIGHSLGGYTAGNLCAHMNEVKTCVFFDTSPMSDYFYTDMKKPSLFIYAKTDNTINPYIHRNPTSPITVITIKNANHFSFMEQGYLAPSINPLGNDTLISGNQVLDIVYKSTTDFLVKNMNFIVK